MTLEHEKASFYTISQRNFNKVHTQSTPTSFGPEAVITTAGTACLARSSVRHKVSLIIKNLLLPAAERSHLLSPSAEDKASHIHMTRSFGRMTVFEGQNVHHRSG